MKSVHARARTTMKFHTIARTMRRRALFLWQLGGQMEMMVGYDSCIQSVFHTLVIYSVYIYTQVVIMHHAIPIEYMNTMLM